VFDLQPSGCGSDFDFLQNFPPPARTKPVLRCDSLSEPCGTIRRKHYVRTGRFHAVTKKQKTLFPDDTTGMIPVEFANLSVFYHQGSKRRIANHADTIYNEGGGGSDEQNTP